MQDKDITLAAVVRVAWLAGLLVFAVTTIASPVLFILALFCPEGLGDVGSVFNDVFNGGAQNGG